MTDKEREVAVVLARRDLPPWRTIVLSNDGYYSVYYGTVLAIHLRDIEVGRPLLLVPGRKVRVQFAPDGDSASPVVIVGAYETKRQHLQTIGHYDPAEAAEMAITYARMLR